MLRRFLVSMTVVLGSVGVAGGNDRYYYWPAAPVLLPYVPPMSYGPGNHYPFPFQQWYPEHPYAHLYYPYLYHPYSAYYSYPTLDVYGQSYNPFVPPPALRLPVPVHPRPQWEQLPTAPRPQAPEAPKVGDPQPAEAAPKANGADKP
jgi:hypothetical protein